MKVDIAQDDKFFMRLFGDEYKLKFVMNMMSEVYRILTNTANQECIIFLKYASPKSKVKNEKYYSGYLHFRRMIKKN
ncbi:hypothetical protein [Anaerosacchariphilus polymeriproducens]|uniref:Uncharacterized protein n=1 Tax=Anaerosacchariphilus polymeriproducens TaxID=1812858 RepID=A0A371AVM4_9FIRM|nr:hypothetical protein [Anaerosacchariphilus polymeriproducens]RDU23520.1 hypothetical protein DWV06_09195 [Anaerosacchariphilus polymeriproducens]